MENCNSDAIDFFSENNDSSVDEDTASHSMHLHLQSNPHSIPTSKMRCSHHDQYGRRGGVMPSFNDINLLPHN